jgi:hypothetical protein
VREEEEERRVRVLLTTVRCEFSLDISRLDVLAELASSQQPISNDSSMKDEFETSIDETNVSLSSLNSSIKSEESVSSHETSSNSSLSPTFVLKTTQKGKPCILLDGHRYKHRRDNLDGSMSWTCTQYV